MTIDKFSWGYRRRANINDYLTLKDITKVIATTVRSVKQGSLWIPLDQTIITAEIGSYTVNSTYIFGCSSVDLDIYSICLSVCAYLQARYKLPGMLV